MPNLELLPSTFSAPPESYTAFIERSRLFVESKGLSWQVPIDELGNVHKTHAWDLRLLTGSHARAASRLTTFAVDREIIDLAVAGGWPIPLLPSGTVLSPDVQNFLKAVAAHRCKQSITPRTVRNEFLVIRRMFSVTRKRPWELSTDEINRFMELLKQHNKTLTIVSALVGLINQKILSVNVPIAPGLRQEFKSRLVKTIVERKDSHKLPSPGALHELTRIVFQEKPVGHQDRIRFCAIKLLLFTGLRLNEILLLPADCLKWEEHTDVVTGKPAGEVGGASRSLRLRYFGEKREQGRPDVLVEDYQWIPERFHGVVVETIATALRETLSLRTKCQAGTDSQRQFQTDSGSKLVIADMLLLVIQGHTGELPPQIPDNLVIETLAESSLYSFLGRSPRPGRLSLFTRYGTEESNQNLSVNPHSLRNGPGNTVLTLSATPRAVTAARSRAAIRRCG